MIETGPGAPEGTPETRPNQWRIVSLTVIATRTFPRGVTITIAEHQNGSGVMSASPSRPR